MNNSPLDVKDNSIIITETKNLSSAKEWNDIGETWKRKCPKCNNDLFYKNKRGLLKSTRKNQVCRKCGHTGITIGPMTQEQKRKISEHHLRNGVGKWMKGRTPSIEIRLKISRSNKGRVVSDVTRQKISISNTGKKLSDETRQKISKHQIDFPRIISNKTRQKLSNAGKKRAGFICSDETKKKIRMATVNRLIKKHGTTLRHNENACKYFNTLNEENKWNLQHAMNGGEITTIGYFLDAYDKQRNIVVEYDEPHHNYPCYKQKDLIRQQNIINHLNCDFYRYDETTNMLSQVHSTGHIKNSL